MKGWIVAFSPKPSSALKNESIIHNLNVTSYLKVVDEYLYNINITNINWFLFLKIPFFIRKCRHYNSFWVYISDIPLTGTL